MTSTDIKKILQKGERLTLGRTGTEKPSGSGRGRIDAPNPTV